MDSSPVPPPDAAMRRYPSPDELVSAYGLPIETQVRLALFLNAAERWVDAVTSLASLPAPSLEKQGRGVASLTLRARELAGKFRQLEADEASEPVPVCALPRWEDTPEWLSRREGLREAVALTAGVCDEMLAAAARLEAPAGLLSSFRRAVPALDLALRELPRLQEHLTRLILREEYLK